MGKDSATKFLISHMRTTGSKKMIQKGSFAYDLKCIAYRLYKGCGLQTPEFYEEDHNSRFRDIKLKNIDLTPREIWIEIGNKCRDIYPMTWVDCLFNTHNDADILVISDCRFPNEANRIHDFGGLVIRIDRPDLPHTDDAADIGLAEYDGWDYVITNDGDLNKLYKSVKEMVIHFKL